MKVRDIVIAVVIIGVVGFILYNISSTDNTPEIDVTSTPSATERDLEERFQRDIPDDADRVELKSSGDVMGDTNVSAIASRNLQEGRYLATVLADLGHPMVGNGYYAWIGDGENYLLLGRMQQAKGGWLIDYDSATDYSEYDEVVVSEQQSVGTAPENVVLQGTFE